MSRHLRAGEIAAGLAFAGLGLYIVLTASGWTLFGPEGPGPGFFPLGYGLLMAGCALALLIQALRSRTGAVEPAAKPAEAAEQPATGAALLAWVALAASIPLMAVLGFVAGFGLVLLFLIRFVFGKSWTTSLVAAAAIVLTLHLAFPVLLSSPLPRGMLWGF